MTTATDTQTAVPTGTWTVDPQHSSVEFAVKHLGIATVRGKFGSFEGTLEVGEGRGATRAYGTVDVASVDTGEPQRDDHLRSADFFDAENLPQIEFTSKAIAVDGDEVLIVGDITLHGVTREIKLEGTINGTEQDPWGNDRVGLELRGEINRGDFGMKFNQALGSGNLLVGEKVKLTLEISAIKQASA